MGTKIIPNLFLHLQQSGYIDTTEIADTSDGFWMVRASLSDILAKNDIHDFPDMSGERLLCSRFFDDWFLYAVQSENDYTYSLLKLREQEHDAKDGSPADGDTPGVTISFISFDCETLKRCLSDPTDENRMKLSTEINRVVAYRGQRHHYTLKRYFKNPHSQAPYLVADVYTKHIASFSINGILPVPDAYKSLVQRSISYKNSAKLTRLPRFIDSLNQAAGRIICDNENIYIANQNAPDAYESAAILATHTGNTSVYSFAAEVEYHAIFLTPLAKIKIPFWGKSIYDSAIRADMTVDDKEFEGPAPFYKSDSKIVKRQRLLHLETAKNLINPLQQIKTTIFLPEDFTCSKTEPRS